MRFLSLGAGVQSSTIALMMKHGEIEACDHAIFADTKAEGIATYRWLEWLTQQLPFPVHIVQEKEGLTKEIELACSGAKKRCSGIPFHLKTGGMLRRGCTEDYKIDPIKRKMRALGATSKNVNTQVFGISADEARRITQPKVRYIHFHEYSLIKLGMTRQDCLRWLSKNGYPTPPRSSCVYCPYRCAEEWYKMKTLYPSDFAEAVRIDYLIRTNLPGVKKTEKYEQNYCYVHRSLKPLDQVIFFNEDRDITMTAEGECEGMCGI